TFFKARSRVDRLWLRIHMYVGVNAGLHHLALMAIAAARIMGKYALVAREGDHGDGFCICGGCPGPRLVGGHTSNEYRDAIFPALCNLLCVLGGFMVVESRRTQNDWRSLDRKV